MKTLIATAAILLSTIAPVGTVAALKKSTTTSKTTTTAVATSTSPSYCGTSYGAIYQYPTGSYWASQIAAYPDYYAANNAYYVATYGC